LVSVPKQAMNTFMAWLPNVPLWPETLLQAYSFVL
jgi:hypothetical protein